MRSSQVVLSGSGVEVFPPSGAAPSRGFAARQGGRSPALEPRGLERTQPGLPLVIGHIRTKTHDYVRHGTVTMFAALNYLEGKLITRLAPRHRNQEWLAFLKTIYDETPADLDIHIIADNYATHSIPRSPDGSIATRDFTCITRRLHHPG
jgi:hypothetical protein